MASQHRDDHIAILCTFGDALERGDAVAAAALFTPDATYDEAPAFHFTGQPALSVFITDFVARHHAVRFSVKRRVASSDDSLEAAEWRWEYTRNVDNERKVFEGMCFIEIRDGLIASWKGFSAAVK